MDRVLPFVVAVAIAACDNASAPTLAPVDASSAPIAASSPALTASAAPSIAPTPSFVSPVADKDRACDFARNALAEFASTFPTKCTADADCNGYYVGATACEPALMLAKPGVPPPLEAHLVELQGAVRASCLAPANACAPRPFRARCKTGRCTDDLRAK